MFDFPFEKATVWTSLYCLCYFFILLTCNYKEGIYRYCLNRTVSHHWKIFFIGLFFVTHTLRGDFFHMMENVRGYQFIVGAYNYGEPIYIAIAQFVNKNYFIFRTIVWGGAFLLFCYTAKRMRVPVYQAAVLLLLNYAILFGYARATAAMAIYFLGLSFICNTNNIRYSLISNLIGIFLILISSYFHASSYILIGITLLLFVPLRKWSIVLTVILFPVIIYLFRNIFEYILNSSTNELVTSKASYYLERERDANGLSGLLLSFLQYASFYVPFIISTICIFKKTHFEHIHTRIKGFYKVTFGLIFLSICFYFIGDNFYVYFYRILYMSMIPLTIIITYLYQNGFMLQKQMKNVVFIGVAFNAFRYVYDLYVFFVE